MLGFNDYWEYVYKMNGWIKKAVLRNVQAFGEFAMLLKKCVGLEGSGERSGFVMKAVHPPEVRDDCNLSASVFNYCCMICRSNDCHTTQ